MQINSVIKKPIITEKSMKMQESENCYQFSVNLKATKSSIIEAVEDLFGVNVVNVKTLVMPGKPKRILRTRRFTKTPKWKKAIVKIRDGQTIKLTGEGK